MRASALVAREVYLPCGGLIKVLLSALDYFLNFSITHRVVLRSLVRRSTVDLLRNMQKVVFQVKNTRVIKPILMLSVARRTSDLTTTRVEMRGPQGAVLLTEDAMLLPGSLGADFAFRIVEAPHRRVTGQSEQSLDSSVGAVREKMAELRLDGGKV